jgi:hypothetical protein
LADMGTGTMLTPRGRRGAPAIAPAIIDVRPSEAAWRSRPTLWSVVRKQPTARTVVVVLLGGILAVVAFVVVACVRGPETCPAGQALVRVVHAQEQGGESWVCKQM